MNGLSFVAGPLGDFYLLATVLLLGVLMAERWVAQPARRMAIAWSAGGALIGLALLCATPGWVVPLHWIVT